MSPGQSTEEVASKPPDQSLSYTRTQGTDMLEDQIQQGVQQGLLGGVATRRRAFGVS